MEQKSGQHLIHFLQLRMRKLVEVEQKSGAKSSQKIIKKQIVVLLHFQQVYALLREKSGSGDRCFAPLFIKVDNNEPNRKIAASKDDYRE